MPLSREDINAAKRWENYRLQVKNSTTVNARETEAEKNARIARLLKPGNEAQAFAYYFPNYCTSPFAPFHLRFIKKVCTTERGIIAAKWSRSLAKSAVVMMLTWIETQRGKAKCVIYGSYNEDTAAALLKPLKINLESNRRIINDFGPQRGAVWTDDEFITNNGVAFYAFGSGQSPRGIRNEAHRPDFIVIDDLDNREQSLNPERVKKAADWVFQDLIPTFSTKGGRVVAVSNVYAKDMAFLRIADKADYVEQVDLLTQTKTIDNAQIKQLSTKLETASQNERVIIEEAIRYLSEGYQSSWPDNFDVLDAVWKMDKAENMRRAQAEYFNNPISEGSVFTNAMLQDAKLPPLKQYSCLEVYIDPSWKKTSTADTKAVVLVGAHKGQYHIIKAFCGIASTVEMYNWVYDIHNMVTAAGAACNIRMEVVFAQSLILDELTKIGADKGRVLPIRADERKKPDKDQRIESLSGYFERGLVYFNEAEANNHHMKRLKEQFLAFQPGVKTPKDGPDAVEGAFYYLVQAATSNVDSWIVGPAQPRSRF